MLDMWTYRTTVVLEPAVDLTGFKVEANDGSIGKVDESTADAGKSYIVVDTGPWIFRRKVILPAQTIETVPPRRPGRLRRPDEGRSTQERARVRPRAWDRPHVPG